MEIYVFFDKISKAVLRLEKLYVETLNFKESIYSITQPKSPFYSKIKIQNNNKSDNFSKYIELLETFNVNERLSNLEKTISNGKKFLKMKELELRKSKECEDRIYCLSVLDKKSVLDISFIVGYQKSAVYSILRKIKAELRKNEINVF